MTSNFCVTLSKTDAIAVELEIMATARGTSAIPEPGMAEGFSEFMPVLNPVGHQSTKRTDDFVRINEIAVVISFGVTSPLRKIENYNNQWRDYLTDT